MQEQDFRTFDEMVSVLARNAPHALILDWWRRLDRTLDYYFIAFHRDRPKDYLSLLATDGRVAPEIVSIVDGLRRCRNEVAHRATQNLSPDDAARFAAVALLAIGAIGFAVPNDLAITSGAACVV